MHAQSAADTVDASTHLPLMRRVAHKMARRCPSQVDVDDLIGAGSLGLVDATRKFDASRASFAASADRRRTGRSTGRLAGVAAEFCYPSNGGRHGGYVVGDGLGALCLFALDEDEHTDFEGAKLNECADV